MQNSVGQYQSQQTQNNAQQPAACTLPNNQSGVYIQIYNPAVATPGSSPVYNVNAPSYGTNPFENLPCYPANYYTQQLGPGCYANPQYNTYPVNGTQTYQQPNNLQPSGQQIPSGETVNNGYIQQYPANTAVQQYPTPNGQAGQYPTAVQQYPAPNGQAGQYQPASNAATGTNGQYTNGFAPQNSNIPYQQPNGVFAPNQQNQPYQQDNNSMPAAQQNTYNQQGQTVNGNQINGNQNITINNPQQAADAQSPEAGNTNNTNNLNSTNTSNGNKETEKRTIVMLTDDYIKNVENYLNSQDKEVRLMGAKEVAARALEDNSRKDDPALIALCNKMIQDPDMKVRFLGLSLLYSRNLTGDDYTVKVLQNMQNSTSGYGQDALMAANILLKMSGQTAEKEFEVTSKNKKQEKTEDINKVMTLL